MAEKFSAALSYSYRRANALTTQVSLSGQDATNAAALSKIDALLADAASAYNRRAYDVAVGDYQQARALLWSQLFPLTKLDDSHGWRTDLMRTLVSYSAEWLNVLP